MNGPTSHHNASRQFAAHLIWAFAVGLALPNVNVPAATYPAGRSAENWQYAADTYGRGVHALFACQYLEATGLFDQSIGTGVQDPRPYYFRGVVKMKTGDDGGAVSDFEMGAAIEAKSRGTYDIGMSLVRVQGGVRHKLEEVRRRALADALRHGSSSNYAPPGDDYPGATADPGDLISPENLPADVTDPFADDRDDDPEMVPAPSKEPAPPAKEPPAEEPPAEVDESNPLADDPFGAVEEPAAEEPAIEEAPADAGDAPETEENPFGAFDEGESPF